MPVLVAFLLWAVSLGGLAQERPAATPGASRPQPVINVGGRVERPDVRVGDLWRFRVTDGYTNLTQAVSVEVVAVTENRIHTRTSRSSLATAASPADGGIIEIWDRDWNQLRQGGTDYTPFYPSFQFPLEPGKQWSGAVQWRYTSGVMNHKLTAQVAGWERVTVPAGSFDAVRINLRGNFIESQSINYYAASGNIADVIWYAPAIGQIVKKEIAHHDFSNTRAAALAERWELLEYKFN